MTKRLHGWGLVTAVLTMFGTPADVRAAGPHEASEVRGSNDGSSTTGLVALEAPPVSAAEPERSVTTTTGPSLVPISDPFVHSDAHQPARWSPGTIAHGAPRTTVKVVTTTTVRSSPYQVHHHHHHWTPSTASPRPQPPTEPAATPPAVFSLPRYAAFPYADGSHGQVERVPWPTGTPAFGEGSPPGRLFSGQISTDSGTAGKGVLRLGVATRLSYWRLAVDGNVSYLWDRGSSDALYLGSGNAMLAPILRPRLVWWVGGGLNLMMDARTNDEGRYPVWYGPNLTTSVDVFPVRPLVVSARLDVGTLGGAPLMGGRATAGLMMKRFEIYGGYQLQRIAAHALRGPLVGLRVWF